jgi:hypothetical protein
VSEGGFHVSQTSEEYDELKFEGFSGNEFLLMVRLSNFFDNPRSPKSFKSKEAICKVCENTSNPSPMIKRVVGKMEVNRFLKYNAEGRLEFDEVVFDKWVEGESGFGKEIWVFFDRHATYFRIKP